MHLKDYLAATGTSQTAFGQTIGRSQTRISQLCNDREGLADPQTAQAIINSTGGMVTAKDLRPDWAVIFDGEDDAGAADPWEGNQ